MDRVLPRKLRPAEIADLTLIDRRDPVLPGVEHITRHSDLWDAQVLTAARE